MENQFNWISPDDELPVDKSIVLIRPKIFGMEENPLFGAYDVCQYHGLFPSETPWHSIADADMTEYTTDSIMCWSYIPDPE